MKLINVLQKHIRDISIYQGADLHEKIATLIYQNQNLSETELFDKIYSEYGKQIKFLENATQTKSIINIKSWVATFGFFFLLGIFFLIIYFAILFIK